MLNAREDGVVEFGFLPGDTCEGEPSAERLDQDVDALNLSDESVGLRVGRG